MDNNINEHKFILTPEIKEFFEKFSTLQRSEFIEMVDWDTFDVLLASALGNSNQGHAADLKNLLTDVWENQIHHYYL